MVGDVVTTTPLDYSSYPHLHPHYPNLPPSPVGIFVCDGWYPSPHVLFFVAWASIVDRMTMIVR